MTARIESMTGYGESHVRLGEPTFNCRARSVNHRHLDVKVRLPRPDLVTLDLAVRKRIAELFKRGAIEIAVTVEAARDATQVGLNARAAEVYIKESRALARKLKLPSKGLSLDALLRLPGVIESSGTSENIFEDAPDEQLLAKLIEPALAALQEARRAEGAKLRKIILELLAEMRAHVKAIIELEPVEKERARNLMIERAKETLKLLDLAGLAGGGASAPREAGEEFQGRLHEEAVFWIERRDFAEERARLELHLNELGKQISGEASGRKLEFLVQEIQREINTLGTKAQVNAITTHTIELKTILERVREQLANVE